MKYGTIWNKTAVEAYKSTHGIDVVFVCTAKGSDALGFFKEDVFWVARGSRIVKVSTMPYERYFEERLRTDLCEFGYIKDGFLVRDENMLTKKEAVRAVTGSPFAREDWWRRA